MYTHLIWDFNGTILDDVQASIQSANKLLSAHGLPLFQSREDYHALFGFPISEYYQRMGFDFSRNPYADLAVEWVAYYLECSRDATIFPDLLPSLRAASDRGVRHLILSASEVGLLEQQVRALGVRDCFDELLGLGNIHAHSKEEIGLAWREKNPDARPLLLGDTEHDAQVARAIGCDCVLIARGHQSRAILENSPCLFVADTLDEVMERIF